MERAFARSVEEVLHHFEVSPETGLSVEAVQRARQKYGSNGRFPDCL